MTTLEQDESKSEKVAELLVDLLNPVNEESYKQLGKKHGFCDKAVKALHTRMMTVYQPGFHELRDISSRDLLKKVESRLNSALDHMTEGKMALSSAKDLSVIVGILAEKRQLLRGEPTQIVSVEESKRIQDLLPLIVEEAMRRGMHINGPVIEGEFTSEEPYVEPRKNHEFARGSRKVKFGRPGSPQR